MISKNGNIYLLRKRIINEPGRTTSKYVMAAAASHFRPTQYNPLFTPEDSVTNRTEIETTRDRKNYIERCL